MNIGLNRMIGRACLLLFLLLFSMPAAASEPVHTAQKRFRIPYHSDPAELARLGAREVRLYVSRDRGSSWNQTESVAPAAGHFTFEAPGDGEFWFAVRTVDGAGRLYPANASRLTAGLKVIVDSQKPSLVLSLDREGNQIRLSWQARDAALDGDTLKLEKRHSTTAQWIPLHLRTSSQGRTSWRAPEAGTVSVRGSVSDRAGNRAEATTDLTISDDGYAPLPARPDLEGPIAGIEAKKPPQSDLPSGDVKGRFVSRKEEVPPLAKRQPVEAPLHVAVADQETETAQSAPKEPKSEPPSDRDDTTPKQPERESPPRSFASPDAPAASPSDAKVVGARQFELGYKVQDVGPSGVGKVEFFITEDNGQRWYRYGSDADRQSPFAIQVPREGTYGFLVRVRSGVGLGEMPPRPGEEPAFRVVVDQTPPVVEIAPPTQNAADGNALVRLNWQTRDPHPAPSGAVDIAYGPSAEGPWTPIADKIDDTGQYDWRPQDVPGGRLFVRISARDAAGNVGRSVTDKPVVVDFVKPTARIINVEVSDAEGQ